MPDTRFSWRALLEHLRKFGAIYLIGIAVCLFGTNLLWTMTAPTIPPEQSVIVYLAAGYSNPEPLSGIASEMLTETQKMDNTLRSVEFQSLQYIESEMDYSGPMTLLARLSVGEGDAFLASRQVMDQLVLGGALLPLDEIVENGWMKRFELEPYYVTVEDGETGEKIDNEEPSLMPFRRWMHFEMRMRSLPSQQMEPIRIQRCMLLKLWWMHCSDGSRIYSRA